MSVIYHSYQYRQKYFEYHKKLNSHDRNVLHIKHLKNRNIIIFTFEGIIKIKIKYDEYYGKIKKNVFYPDEQKGWGKRRLKDRKSYSKYFIFLNDNLWCYINIRKSHRIYDVKYNICKLYRSFENCEFKYKILKLRTANYFWFFWKELLKDWDEEFLKNNLWSRQILIDFMCRFNKLDLLYKNKKRKWIIDKTEYFYFKGFRFEIKRKIRNLNYIQNIHKKIIPLESSIISNFPKESITKVNQIEEQKYKFITHSFVTFDKTSINLGYKNKTKEFVKFFEKEECIINYNLNYESIIRTFNCLTIFKFSTYDYFGDFYFDILNGFNMDDEYIRKTLQVNIKSIYQIVVNDNFYNLRRVRSIVGLPFQSSKKQIEIAEHIKNSLIKFHGMVKKFIEDIDYPSYLKRRIKNECIKKILENL